MNNKGFAITSIIYSLMLLFILVISSFLSILVGRNRRMDELVESVYETVRYEQIFVPSSVFTEQDGDSSTIEDVTYVTEQRGLYHFGYYSCYVFLPKSVAVVTGKTKNPSDPSISNKLYFKLNGGSYLEEYQEIVCIN